MPLELTPDESQWRDELEHRLSQSQLDADCADPVRELREMRDLAVRLHNSLRDHGHNPVHHGYMIENRGVQPDDPEFYFHIHPIEDLIRFTHDPHANDDPADITIDVEFTFRVFSRRWGHEDPYRITRTASGWYLKGLSEGPCDKAGHPVLWAALRHDSIQYPRDTGDWLEWLWEKAKDQGLSREQVQQGLDDVAQWVNLTERSTPAEGVWKGLA